MVTWRWRWARVVLCTRTMRRRCSCQTRTTPRTRRLSTSNCCPLARRAQPIFNPMQTSCSIATMAAARRVRQLTTSTHIQIVAQSSLGQVDGATNETARTTAAAAARARRRRSCADLNLLSLFVFFRCSNRANSPLVSRRHALVVCRRAGVVAPRRHGFERRHLVDRSCWRIARRRRRRIRHQRRVTGITSCHW